ncbi:MFS transporter [Acetobacter oeni]|uniref:MFS transporter n=1 Tax=Acetobacter oeni TaxID=304077 RepID=A0A511XLI4_9PROT|nr:MFS transporter [Acetobacter oeni]MBB3883604.1 EmrB/QacA subfamily drug resistance transporter [Acetobacter oeni]NHO19658.1 MFS transporter [Acetobacter oeni]GBR02742.1 major facilitator superfamily transporter [Acetobacter oeni LMG 21952]GEN63810.1 MFS transporter [Acetobacter oeni]
MTEPSAAPARRYSPAIALVLALAAFMQNLDGAIINTSLPQMARSFGVTALDLSMGITAYMLASAAMSPLASWMAMKAGERRVMVVAMLVFTAASVWCGLARGLSGFVLARICQGLAAAVMSPVGMSIMLRYTPKSELMRAQSVTVWPALSAPVIGPVLGGYITQTIGWQWNFWLNLPVGLIAAFAILRIVPPTPPEEAPPLDWKGLALCATGLTCLLAGFQRSPQPGSERIVAIGLMIAGIITGLFAIRHLRAHETPILSLEPLKRPSMRFATLFPGILFRCLFSSAPFLLPLLFQVGFGLSPAVAGSWMLGYFCANLGLKPFTSRILRRFGFRNILFFNGFLAALSMLACVFTSPHESRFLLMITLVFAGATRSMQLTGLSTMMFADVSSEERRAAAGMSSILQQAASAAGVPVMAFCLSVAQSVYGHAHLGLPELHIAFLVSAIVALIGAIGFAKMPENLGNEISGRA